MPDNGSNNDKNNHGNTRSNSRGNTRGNSRSNEIGDINELVGIFDIEDGLTDLNRLFIQKNRIRPPDGSSETPSETSFENYNDHEMKKSLIVTARSVVLSPVSATAWRRRLEHDARIYG